MAKWLVRLTLGAVASLAALVGLSIGRYLLENRTNGSLVSSGARRKYLLHVPKRYDPSTPTPLVIALHGFVQWPANLMQMSRWNDLADEQGFIVVYPAGTGFPIRWQAARESRGGADPSGDVRFISDLIDSLEREYNVDLARVYANGLSNGGGMTFVLSCELSERIAAVGMVAGAYLYPSEMCNPARAVPAVVLHGTDDPIVPYHGRSEGRGGRPFPSVPEWVEALARRNGCLPLPEQLPTRGAVSGVKFAGGETDVVFYTVAGGGHTWPGARGGMEWLVGQTTSDLDATRVIWDFFVQHPLPARRAM